MEAPLAGPPAAGREATPVGPEEAERLFAPLRGSGPLLLAVSGGPDSVALLGLLVRWAGAGPVLAATVDHGLREGSGEEAASVGRLCAILGVPHRVLAWEGARPATRLQERARAARYRLLLAHAQEAGAGLLLTAHHRDDQAETVLMRLARGSGPAGLAGMRPFVRRGGIVHARPLLDVPKARLVATCAAMGLGVLDDPTNRDSRHERARWRRLVPVLAASGLGPERLATLARRAARAEDALDRAAAAAFARWAEAEPAGPALDFRALIEGEPSEIALRVLDRCTGAALPGHGPARMHRLEAAFDALAHAAREGRGLRRTLGGRVLALDAAGRLWVGAEEARRRGRDGRAPPLGPRGDET